MQPVSRPLGWLVLATLLVLSVRFAEEGVAFSYKFPAPPGWIARQGQGVRVPDGPDGKPALRVRGSIFQRPPLINGAGRPIHIAFLYRSPRPGAWVGVVGDVTSRPVRELILTPSSGLQAPTLPNLQGRYQISLPASSTWRRVTIDVRENTPNLPFLSIYLGGPITGDPALFADVELAYQDASENPLIQNGDFVESWPAWAIHPTWLDPEWAPARLLLFLLVVLGVFTARALRRNEGAAPAYLLAPLWVFLSAFLLVGAGFIPDLMRVILPVDAEGLAQEAGSVFAFAVQMALFGFAGWVGGNQLGRRARWLAPTIPLLAGFAMTANAAIDTRGGLLPPTPSFELFTTGWGFLWLAGGTVAVWIGASLLPDVDTGGYNSVKTIRIGPK